MAKIRSFGATITVATNAVGGLTEINGPVPEAAMIDSTTLGSANNAREFCGGLIDGGVVTLAGKYDFADVGQTYLRDHIGGSAACVKTHSSGSKCTFTGIIQAVGCDNPLDDEVTFAATIKVTGFPVVATV
jgi:hypothetical protein